MKCFNFQLFILWMISDSLEKAVKLYSSVLLFFFVYYYFLPVFFLLLLFPLICTWAICYEGAVWQVTK